MKAKQIRNVEAEDQYKAAAFLDARMQNSVNKQNYSLRQLQQATRMEQALQDCYSAKAVHCNYRKTQISIKIEKPFVLRERKALRALEAGWVAMGVVKKDSPQGITYCIKKA